MKKININAPDQFNPNEGQNLILKFAVWLIKHNLPFLIISVAMVVMLFWAGFYKMTMPGADGIVPLVTNSPLISWHFKLFGIYNGSNLIGLTEVTSAVFIIIGWFKPKAGVIGGIIAAVIFFTTSTLIITTPGTLTNVNGIRYMSFLGLFLFKDIINLGASLFLITNFGRKAIAAQMVLISKSATL